MWQLDTTLFSMLIQGGLCDQHGNVWRSDPTHTYTVEVTLTNKEVVWTAMCYIPLDINAYFY